MKKLGKIFLFILFIFVVGVSISSCNSKDNNENVTILEDIKFENKSFIYNGYYKNLAISGTLPEGVEVHYINNNKVNVGVYTVTAVFKDTTGKYGNIPDMKALLVINKADAYMKNVVFSDKTIVYDGFYHGLEIEGKLPEGIEVSYYYNGELFNKVKNAGTYQITAKFKDTTGNYNEIPDMTATLTIEKASVNTNNLYFNNISISYDGNYHMHQLGGELPKGIEVSYYCNGELFAGAKDIGTYQITAKFKDTTGNYNEIPDMTATLTIEKANLYTTQLSFDDDIVSYDGNIHKLEVGGEIPAGIEVSYYCDGELFVGAKNAGTYYITAKFKDTTGNYNEISNMTAVLTINKADIDMTSLIFNNSEISYDGYKYMLEVEGEIPEGIEVSYYCDGELFTGAKDAGTYQITAKFTDTIGNYNEIPNMTATLKINKTDVNIKNFSLNDKTVVYDGIVHKVEVEGKMPLGVDATYYCNGELFTGAKDAGTYQITAKFKDTLGNYNEISDMTATLTINKADAIINVDDCLYEYGEVINPTYKTQGFLDDDLDKMSIDLIKETGVIPGQYKIKASNCNLENNYNIIYNEGVCTITKRELIISDREISIFYDEKEHKDYVIEFSNIVEGDTVNVSYVYSGNMIDVGEYVITINIDENPKYLLSNNTIKVLITKEILSITFVQEGYDDVIKNVLYGDSLIDIPSPKEITGYSVSWDRNNFDCIKENIVVNIVKEANIYVITYHENIPNENVITQEVKYDSDIVLKSLTDIYSFGNFDGYSLLNWNTQKDGKGDNFNFGMKMVYQTDHNIDLYANYECIYNVNTITYNDALSCSISGIKTIYSSKTDLVIPNYYFKYDYATTNIIAYPIVKISKEAFIENNNITMLSFKNDSKIECIEKSAFYKCKNLDRISIPDSIICIEDSAFRYCNITVININPYSSLEKIGPYAFGSNEMTSLTLPENLKLIEECAFDACEALATIHLYSKELNDFGDANGAKKPIFDSDLYGNVNEMDLYVYETVERIPAYFMYNNYYTRPCYYAKNIYLENATNLKSIGMYAFRSLNTVTSITLPEGLKRIEDYAFYHTNLTSITIPKSVEYLGDRSFGLISTLETIYFNAINCNINETKLIKAFSSSGLDTKTTALYVGDDVKFIASYLFSGSYIYYVNISETSTLEKIADNTFNEFKNIKSIYIPATVSYVGADAFYGTHSSLVITVGMSSIPTTWNPTWNSSKRNILYRPIQ